MAVLDQEIEWHEPDVDVPWRGIHRGHDSFVSWLHIIGRELADLVVQPHEFIATDDTVVVLGHESARVTATGRHAYHSDFAFVFRVRNGKLTRLPRLSRHRRDDAGNSGLITRRGTDWAEVFHGGGDDKSCA